jgi:D-alanyl-D-alanine dipeptidase
MILTEFSNQDFEVVEFQNNKHSRIKIEPMYFKLGFSPFPQIFGRNLVLNKLIQALHFIPEHYGFLVWDVYRPREVQGKLFNWMREEIRRKYPHLTEEENYTQSQKYMSAPSQIGDAYCPPHLSGGAIDLTLYDITNNNELDMGTVFDDCSTKAHSNYFDLKIDLLPEEINIKKSRTILRTAMEKVGFTVYQYEWWHFDIGNIFWSHQVQKPPFFGPLFGDNEWPNKMKGLSRMALT